MNMNGPPSNPGTQKMNKERLVFGISRLLFLSNFLGGFYCDVILRIQNESVVEELYSWLIFMRRRSREGESFGDSLARDPSHICSYL